MLQNSSVVNLYSAEHYAYWRETLEDPGLPHGVFGENLTVTGFDEAGVHVGDELAVGSATLCHPGDDMADLVAYRVGRVREVPRCRVLMSSRGDTLGLAKSPQQIA